jgi:uncharacterized GH25 family protein
MNITLLSVEVQTVPTAKGSYQKANVAYKNNSFQGKVEGKQIMSFGATKNAFTTLSTAAPGTTYEVEIVKNDKGYNDWISLSPATAGAAAPVATPAAGVTGKPSAAASPRSTYETPEERAQRQVMIVRQSSLSTAVSTLAVGSKKEINPEDVVQTAKRFEAYVLGLDTPTTDDGSIAAMESDEFPDVG